jgi:pilus assembly protein CpaE
VPPAIADLTRRHPGIGVVIVASSLDPAMMLETFHAGAKNFLAAPLTPERLDEALKRVVGERPATEGHVLAFVGAKGGTGTTTLAVNVATALARLSKGEALLVDLHTRFGDVTACLGLEPRFTVADALDNTHRLDEAFMRGLVARSAADLDVLAASDRGLPGAQDLARLRSFLKFARSHYQYIVLDVPRTDLVVLEALDATARIILVLSQELTAVRSAARLLPGLLQRHPAERVLVAVARQDRQAEFQAEDLEKTLGRPVRMFPNDYRQALDCLNRGRPLVLENHSRLADEVTRFVRELTGAARNAAKPARSSLLPSWLGGGQS